MDTESQLKILVVDDVRTIRVYVRTRLERLGYITAEAKNGEEALEKIRQDRPHLVLMDIVMPLMDGITCCRKIKTDSEIKHTKVIMITGTGEYGKVAEAFRAGCDDYITKPIDPEELARKVRELCDYILCREKLKSVKEKDETIPKYTKKGSLR